MQSRFDYFKSQWATDKFDLSFTTCVCTLDIQDATADEIFNRCSAAMQEAKACGKGLHHHYEELRERIDKRQQVMRSALTIDDLVAQDKLTLYGQAIVANEKEQTLPRYEILLRVLENGQHHSPFMILEAAEKYDKSVLIDRFVVNQVFEFLKASQAPFVCSINISAQSLNHQSFIDYLVQKVTDNQHLSGLLIFELTETTILGNLDVAKNLFEQLHSLGCRIAIDDFGVGESSLRYLMELSVDIVKIDGFFIKQLKSSTKARSLVEAMVSICDALDIETVGEFVEDEKTQRLITDIGVTYSQGYGVHIPEALSDAIQKRHL